MAVDDSYTKVLLHFDGADASTTFTDESGKSWSRDGDAQIDTAQSKFGGASGLFDGTGDDIYTADNNDFYCPGDRTIDFWLRFNSAPGAGAVQMIYEQYDSSTNSKQRLYIENTLGTLYLKYDFIHNGSPVVEFSGSVAISAGTWYHIADVRTGNDYKFFLDGTQVGSTVTDADVIPNIGGSMYLGKNPEGTNYFNGWLDEFRWSKGIARWTTNFTPQASAYTPPGAQLIIWS